MKLSEPILMSFFSFINASPNNISAFQNSIPVLQPENTVLRTAWTRQETCEEKQNEMHSLHLSSLNQWSTNSVFF